MGKSLDTSLASTIQDGFLLTPDKKKNLSHIDTDAKVHFSIPIIEPRSHYGKAVGGGDERVSCLGWSTKVWTLVVLVHTKTCEAMTKRKI